MYLCGSRELAMTIISSSRPAMMTTLWTAPSAQSLHNYQSRSHGHTSRNGGASNKM